MRAEEQTKREEAAGAERDGPSLGRYTKGGSIGFQPLEGEGEGGFFDLSMKKGGNETKLKEK